MHGRLPLGLSASLWRRGLRGGVPPTGGCGAGEGGSLLGSLRPRSPEKGPSGCALSFSWQGGRRGDAATPGAGGEGGQSERLIVRELGGRGGWEGTARPSSTLCWFINERAELSGSAARLLAHENKMHTLVGSHKHHDLCTLIHRSKDTTMSNLLKQMWRPGFLLF